VTQAAAKRSEMSLGPPGSFAGPGRWTSLSCPQQPCMFPVCNFEQERVGRGDKRDMEIERVGALHRSGVNCRVREYGCTSWVRRD
jgi:hypothetical protein